MHYEHEGMSLWYGTSDAPAPEGAVHAGTAVTATIAVKPTDASNKVELLYRRDQGTVETVTAKWLRHDISHNAQYFKARFPVFRVGDTVEYTAVCYCAGRQVPSSEEAKQLVSSFHVVATEIKPTPDAAVKELMLSSKGVNGSSKDAISPVGESLEPTSPSPETSRRSASEASTPDGTTNPVTQPPIAMPQTTSMRLNSAMLDKSALEHLKTNSGNNRSMEEALNAALKSRLTSAFMDKGTSTLAELVQSISPVDITANKDVSIRAFVAKQLQGRVQRDAVLKKDVDAEVGKLSDKTTIGDLLGLDKPIKYHPLFQSEVQRVALNSLLSTSSVMSDTKLQDTFTNLYAEHEGSIQDFWDKLREQPDFKAPGTVENIQFTLQLGVLTQNNMPLVQALQVLRQKGTLQSARDLTRLDADAWTKLITIPGSSISVPSSIPGATQEEKVATYVNTIITTLQSAFPTSYVAQGVAKQPEIDLKLVKTALAQNPSLNLRDALPGNLNLTGISATDREIARASIEALHREMRIFPGLDFTTPLSANGASGFQNPLRQAISQFFANAPDFDFRDTHIETYIAQNAEAALKGIDDKYKDAIPSQLKLMQRVFQVTPRYEAMSALLGEGIHSAYRITHIPQTTFVERFKDKLGDEAQARAIYTKADFITAMTTTLHTQYARAFNTINPPVMGNTEDMFAAIPNYAELFDTLDLCDCEHCRSVYSPAAYLVDLLQFLYNAAPNDDNETPLDVLTRRRADLKYIRLNCVNTETPMPYIDLVNEIMESYVVFHNALPNVPGTALPNPKDTSPNATAEELSVNPENTDDLAYKPLQDQDVVYPQILPFNRPLEVVRTYLEYLGSSRYQVMNTFKNKGVPLDQAINSEYLKISADEYKIITGKNFKGDDVSASHFLWEFYGYTSSTVNGNSWESDVSNVQEFLQRTTISYLDLIELLKMRIINPNQDPKLPQLVILFSVTEDCDLSKTIIQHLDGSALDDGTLQKMHRFIRLWRKLGWKMRDLDKTMTAMQVLDTTSDFLQSLAQIKRLQTDLNLPLVQLLSLWSNIDTDGDDSLYNKLFQNRAVLNPVDVAFKLKPDGSGLLTPGKISDHTPAILGALHISAANLAILTTDVVTDDALNLSNLSMLYRHTVLARALNLPIKDLLALKTLTGINPFTDSNNPALAGSPATAIEFINKFHKVRQSSFSVAQLDYLYRHLYDPKRNIAPLQRNVDLLMKSLRDGLIKIAGDTALLPDPTGDLLRQKLAIVLDSKLVDQAMVVIDGSAVYTTTLNSIPTITFPAPVKDKISYDTQNKKLRYVGNITQTDKTLLMSLSGDTSYQNAVADLFQQSYQQPSTFISKNLASFLDPIDAISHLLDNVPLPKETHPPTKEERINYVLTPLMAYLRVSLSQNLVKQILSEALKFDTSMTDVLLGSLLNAGVPLILKSRIVASQYAMADFLALLDGGLSVTYFANKDLDATTGTPVTRIDPAINFNWDTGSPDPTIPGNTFSARWTGRVLAQFSETYTFTTHTNNGVRLWVDNQLLISDWKDQPATDHSAIIALKGGQFYDIRMEYYNDSAGAVAELWWSSPSTSKVIIPQTQFYPGSVFASFSLLHKVALLVNSFKMTVQEVTYLSDPAHSSDFPHFDLNALPVVRTDHTDDNVVALFNQWEQLDDLIILRDSLPRGEVSLTDVFEIAFRSDAASKLSGTPGNLSDATVNRLLAATSWDANELVYLTGSTGFGLTDADFKNAAKLLVLQACLALGKRLGVSVQHLFTWTAHEPDAQQALEVKNTVKAKFDDEQWLAVGKVLNDKLRDSQKAALIAYILQMPEIKNKGISDSSRLFEYFLIDVDMNSCMMTSRIKQAISSVQLFIQRCLMNLEEPGVSPSVIDVDVWKWMKHYRVWEANRKVFLYPENWIEPELRDDKSPFFKELETELLQKDITPDNVEQALLNYLEKLDEVSRLEICGMYWECESFPDRNILHVFGRTFTIPHVYYYRRLIDATTWTAWEKVNVNIEGEHLIPIVWNRRLHIFWPIFNEKSDEQTPPVPNVTKNGNQFVLTSDAAAPAKHWEIKIAWSEYKQNKWTPKQVSTDTEVIQFPTYLLALITQISGDPKRFFVFKAFIEEGSGDLKIRCYYEFHVCFEGPFGNICRNSGKFLILGEFHLTGCRGRIDIVPFSEVEYELVTPKNCEVAFMTFKEDVFSKNGNNPFTLIAGDFGDDQFVSQTTSETPLPTLGWTQTPYNLLYPHQFLQFAVQAPFFFQDSQRTYFVNPEWDTPTPSPPIAITRLDSNLPAVRSPLAVIDRGSPPIFNQDASTTGAGLKVGSSASSQQALVDSVAQMTIAGVPKAIASATKQPIVADSIPQMAMAEAPQLVAKDIPSITRSEVGAKELSCDAWGRAQPDMVVSKVKFAIHYHPYVCAFIKALNHYGIPGLLTLYNQKYGITGYYLDFVNNYDPDKIDVDTDYPKQNVDFSPEGAYSLYNWELFFHIPLLIATKLSKNQQFEEAQQWFHYIFNPTDSSIDSWPQRVWRVLPFYNNTEKDKIQTLLELLDYKGNDKQTQDRRDELIKQVDDWRHHSFDPHRIGRLRMIAYQKNVFMKYIDNLIAWGDQLFSQDTIETINEATQLYILAYELLGPRPEKIPPTGTVGEKTYTDLQYLLDKFSNALVNLENQFPFATVSPSSGMGSPGAVGGLGLGTTFYFCIPQNDKLLGYWDTVADRLFKIRNCMNIEGVVRQLPLFEPPIDPALLVQATAMGIDLNSALNDINAATPYYRFTYLLQKALELCSEVRGLGATLLSALEKKDAEALAAIRAGQETAILKAVRQVKEQQVTEAETSLEALNKTREVTNIRFMFYHTIEARTAFEIGQIVELTQAQIFQEISQQHELGASIAHLIPNFDLGLSGFGGSPLATASFGGANVAGALEAIGRQFGSISSMHTFMANMASILGGWDRRAQEWSLQENLAAKELEQIDKQIAAANIRFAIAQLELDNHDKQIENAQAIEDFLHDKYTNQDLYDWMVGQVSTVYKQCYQMAYDLAKRTEKAFRFERGLTTSNYITFGYWDSLKKGLLSGEQLYLDLKRMEMAYLDQNKREYEITKHISLVLFDPMALITLKECGTCLVNLPEALFDMDYPGHYMRRIKSVSLTIPCVAGPYTSINCTLTLLSNQIRKNADLTGDSDPYSGPKDDADALARFITTFGAVESIATSTAQNDSGMFEVNFRDERYLPFEGAGVVSTWRIDMPKDCNAFDFETISDVIIRLNYTAREGGASLSKEAKKVAQLPTPVTQGITTNDTHFPDQPNLTRMFSVKHEFSSDWYRFLHPADITKDQQVLSLDLMQERFPFQFRGRQIDINSIKVFLKLNDKVFYNDDLIFVLREEDITDSSQFTDYPGTFKAAESPICQLPYAELFYAELFKDQAETIGKWKWSILVASTDVSNLQSDPANPPSPSLKQTVKVNGKDYVRLNADAIADIWIVCDYTAKMTVSKLNG